MEQVRGINGHCVVASGAASGATQADTSDDGGDSDDSGDSDDEQDAAMERQRKTLREEVPTEHILHSSQRTPSTSCTAVRDYPAVNAARISPYLAVLHVPHYTSLFTLTTPHYTHALCSLTTVTHHVSPA